MSFSDDFLAQASPDDLRNIVMEQGRAIEALRQAVVELQQVSGIASELGEFSSGGIIAPSSESESAAPTDPGFTGSFFVANGREFNGETYHIGSANLGELQVGINTSGKLVAGRGAINLDADGITIVNDDDTAAYYLMKNSQGYVISKINSYDDGAAAGLKINTGSGVYGYFPRDIYFILSSIAQNNKEAMAVIAASSGTEGAEVFLSATRGGTSIDLRADVVMVNGEPMRGGFFMRVLPADLIMADGESLVTVGYINTNGYDIVMPTNADCEIVIL